VAEEEMKQTPNAQLPTPINREQAPNAQVLPGGTTSNIKRQPSNILWRILDFVAGGIFIYAGVIKALDPVQFANDIDNYKLLPWPVSVALAFYLPWLLALLILVFTLATTAAKVRGLDITCGCFGHASQHWSFPSHLATNLAILAALIVLFLRSAGRRVPGHH